jgi:1-deoxy-D-xylulose-5-phosphate synthase (EC 2.2.1.7)
MKSLLESISQPSEIQNLNLQELTQLAEECRQRIIKVTSKRGGHLASSLGTVEITVALLKNFNFNIDRIVWDVGHQAYAYKILTGRNENLIRLVKPAASKNSSHVTKAVSTILEQDMPQLQFLQHLEWPLDVIFNKKNIVSLLLSEMEQ